MSKYPNPEAAGTLSSSDLIEWLAQIAYDGREDWGWIRNELEKRLQEGLGAGTQSEANESSSGEKAQTQTGK